MKPLVLTAVMAAAYVSAAGQANPSIDPDVINVAGGTFKKGYYSLDFSIGEATLINTMKSPGSNFFLTNGFLQPYIFGLNVPTENPHFTEDEVRLYPNPTFGPFELNIFTDKHGKVKVFLYDRLGKLLYTRENQTYGFGWRERIDLSGYPNGLYTLKVELIPDDGSYAKRGTYKIIKVGR